LLFLAISSSSIKSSSLNEYTIPTTASDIQEPTVLNVILAENKSIGWFQARVILNVTTDVPINLSYNFEGIGESANHFTPENSSVFLVLNGTSEIEINIQPHWSVFPGSFHYSLKLYYINSTTQIPQTEFEISDGIISIIMGVPVTIIIGGVIIIGIIIIIARPVRLRQEKGSYSAESSSITSSLSLNSQNPVQQVSELGKIECPECKKKITEGSAFCPECGYHIPRFLRTRE
jgi:hypothetical protein